MKEGSFRSTSGAEREGGLHFHQEERRTNHPAEPPADPLYGDAAQRSGAGGPSHRWRAQKGCWKHEGRRASSCCFEAGERCFWSRLGKELLGVLVGNRGSV